MILWEYDDIIDFLFMIIQLNPHSDLTVRISKLFSRISKIIMSRKNILCYFKSWTVNALFSKYRTSVIFKSKAI